MGKPKQVYSSELRSKVEETFNALMQGNVILYPTDTIWGIGCDATNSAAIDKIYELKKRSDSKSLIILLDDENKLERYVKQVPDMAWDLIEMSTKPLTIIYPEAHNLPDNLIAEDGSIAIRIVKNDFCKLLIQKLGKPLVSTSANVSGEPSPQNFQSISQEILKGVDHIVNLHAENSQGKASSIIKLKVNGEISIIRA